MKLASNMALPSNDEVIHNAITGAEQLVFLTLLPMALMQLISCDQSFDNAGIPSLSLLCSLSHNIH